MENTPQTTPPASQPAAKWRDLLILLSGAGLIIAFDQFTKALVIKHIPFLGTWLPPELADLRPYFRIVHWHNSGAAFGLFQDGNLVFTILAIVASAFIIAFFPSIEKREWGLRTAMVFQLGGAVGNLIDRLRFGYVIDYISIGDFPVFNVADASISVGVAILLLDVLLTEWRERKVNAGQTEPHSRPSEEFDS